MYQQEIELMELRCEYYATDVRPILVCYKAPSMPTRPAMLPKDDYELLNALEKARWREWSGQADKALCRTFGRWKSVVMESESKATGNIFLLLSNAIALDTMGWTRELESLVLFIWREYGIDIPPMPKSSSEAMVIAKRLSRRRDVISDMLLTGKRKAKPQKVEDDIELFDVATALPKG